MTRELALKPSRFRARRSGASIGSVGGAKVGYRLSEAARVKFIVELATTGRKAGGKCVRATRSNRRKRRCTRYVAVKGSFTHAGAAGRNSFRFSGRLRGKRLKPGYLPPGGRGRRLGAQQGPGREGVVQDPALTSRPAPRRRAATVGA